MWKKLKLSPAEGKLMYNHNEDNAGIRSGIISDEEELRFPSRVISIGQVRSVFGGASLFIAAAVIAVSWVIVSKFNCEDKWMPMFFLIVEAVIAGVSIYRLRTNNVERLKKLIESEENVIGGLGKMGAQLGDSMVYVGDARRDKTGEFQEAIATWANLMIIVGMVGTAGYLVFHASDFILKGGVDLSTALTKLLPLAPKAFSATALALFCAAVLGFSGSMVLHRMEDAAANVSELSQAWRKGAKEAEKHSPMTAEITQAMINALNQGVVQNLVNISQQLEVTALSSNHAADKLADQTYQTGALLQKTEELTEEVVKGFNFANEHATQLLKQTQSIAPQLMQSLERVSTIESRLTSVIETMDKKIIDLEHRISATATDSIAKVEELHMQLLNNLSNKMQNEAPRIIETVTMRQCEITEKRMEILFQNNLNHLNENQEASFDAARSKFEQNIGPANDNVQALTTNVARLDEAIRILGGTINSTEREWQKASADAVNTIQETVTALSGLANAPTPAALKNVSQLMHSSAEQLSRAMNSVKDAGSELNHLVHQAAELSKVEYQRGKQEQLLKQVHQIVTSQS
jgi:hypothetical protein